jgi:hypothetical protein
MRIPFSIDCLGAVYEKKKQLNCLRTPDQLSEEMGCFE